MRGLRSALREIEAYGHVNLVLVVDLFGRKHDNKLALRAPGNDLEAVREGNEVIHSNLGVKRPICRANEIHLTARGAIDGLRFKPWPDNVNGK
jgi:hypothetical protein